MNQLKLSACIVTYNSKDDVCETIQSILNYTKNLNFTLYLSDNNSPDNTAQFLKNKYKDEAKVIVLENKENAGFGYGHNQVLSLIDSDYHFIINPDIIINENTITDIVQFMQNNSNVGMLCPKILNDDGTEQLLPASIPKLKYLVSRYLKIFSKWENEYVKKDKRNTDVLNIEFCTGCFMVIRTDIFKKINGFDDRFFMYFEDADLTRRVNEISDVVMYRKAEVTHKWHRQSSKSLKYFRIIITSMFKYFWKWKFNRGGN